MPTQKSGLPNNAISVAVASRLSPVRVARPERFELPTLWFEALEAGNLIAFVGVA